LGKISKNDIIGRKFGMLQVEKCIGTVNGKLRYQCKCDCGNERTTDRYSLLNGTASSCGCKRRINPEDIVGRRFGRLVAMECVGREEGKRWGNYRYLCQCDCGKTTYVRRDHLLHGDSCSCGDCIHIEEEAGCLRYYTHSGESFLADISVKELLEKYPCYIAGNGYVFITIDGEHELLSRLVLDADKNTLVDHINGNPLDCRRDNLRLADACENAFNTALVSNNTSGYKGVYFHKASGRFHASIRAYGVRIFLGYYDDIEEAAGAYDRAARFFHGEFACVNFPRPGEQCCRRNQEKVVRQEVM